MTPVEVDGCELWQVASVLGFHEPPPEVVQVEAEPPAGLPRPIGSRRGPRKRRVAAGGSALPTDTIRQRYLHHSDPDRYPPPTPKPASAAIFGLVAQAGRQGMVLGEGVNDAD